MKKYKHKTTGDIAELKNQAGYSLNRNTIGLIPVEYIENSNDWEEMIQKDYEVLSLKAIDCQQFIFYLKKNGLYGTSTDTNELGSQALESLLQFSWKINSIRRLSDNEVFSIGDRCNAGEITSIILLDSGKINITMKMSNVYSSTSALESNFLQKAKPVLFVTEDGKQLFENDKVWRVYNDWSFSDFKAQDNPTYPLRKNFSSKEAAQDFVILNKPMLSITDVVNISKGTNTMDMIGTRLKELVKSRL